MKFSPLSLPLVTCAAGATCVLTVFAVTLAPLSSRAQPKIAAAAVHPPTATPGPISVLPPGNEEHATAPPAEKSGDTPPPAKGSSETTETEILATAGATFASKERIAVFMGDVRVNDVRFKLACDKLTVFLNKNASSDTPAGAAATPPPINSPAPAAAGTAGDAKASGNSGGIDHAIAEGHVVIVQERAANPGGEAKRSVGRGDWANFDNKTGDMVLKGNPSVEQNENTHVATSRETVMTLRKDNSLSTIGPSRTIIIQRKNAELPGSGGGLLGEPAATPHVRKPHTAAPAATPLASPTAPLAPPE